METIGYAAIQVIPSLKGMQAAIDSEMGRVSPAAGRKAGEQVGSGTVDGYRQRLSGMATVASTAVAAAGAALVAGGAAAASYGIKLAAANEQATISFTTMLGSGQKAASFLGDLRDFAAATPFEFPELQTAASSLIAAGVSAEKVIPIMTTLGDVTAGMGTGSEGIKRATVALQQMQAAGKITGEDLNQLRDAGIPVYDLLAAATGKAKSEVSALAQAGKLGKRELDQLMTALETGKGLERFSGLMDKQSQSLTGLASTLKDVMGQKLATAMEPAAGELKGMLPVLTDIGGKLIDRIAPGVAKGFGLAADLLPKVADLLDRGLDSLDKFAPALAGVGAAAGALGATHLPLIGQFLPSINPVVAGIAAIALASPEARDALGDVLAQVMPLVGELAHQLLPILGDLSSIAGDVLPPAIGLAGMALRGVLEIAVPLAGAVSALTGVLADHSEIVIGVATAYGTLKAISFVGGITDSARWVAMSGAVGKATMALRAFAVATAITSAAQGVGMVSAAFRVLAGTSVGAGTMAAGALAGIAAGAATANSVLDRSVKHGQDFADTFMKGLDVDTTSITDTSLAMSELSTQMIKLSGPASRSAGRQVLENLSPFNKNTTSEAEDAIDALMEKNKQLGATNHNLIQNYSAVGEQVGLSVAQVERLAQKYGVDLSGSFKRSKEGRQELIGDIESLAGAAKVAGVNLEEAVDLDPEKVKADAEAIKSIMSSVSSSFAAFTDVLQVQDESVDPKQIQAARDAVKDAEEGLRQAHADASTASAEAGRKAADAVNDARGRLAKAQRDLQDIFDDPPAPSEKTGVATDNAMRDYARRIRDAKEAVEEARQGLTVERDDTAASSSDRIDSATETLKKAKEGLSELMDSDSPLNADKIATFYRDTLEKTQTFSANIRTAIEDGYDPAFVGRLLQAGPEKAGPILEQLVGNSTWAFVDMVNNAEHELTQLNEKATEMGRLTQMALNDTSANGRQMVQDLDSAMAISTALMSAKSGTSIEEIARVAGVSIDEARRVSDEYKLGLDEAIDKLRQIQVLDGGVLSMSIAAFEADPNHGGHKRDGGIDHYAAGGIRSSSMIGKGKNLVWWDEPGTGGEGYFPRNATDLGRTNRDMAEVAGWYGGAYLTADDLAKPGYMEGPRWTAPAAPAPTQRAAVAKGPEHVHFHGMPVDQAMREQRRINRRTAQAAAVIV